MKKMDGDKTRKKLINFTNETMKIHIPVDDIQIAKKFGLKKEDTPYPCLIFINVHLQRLLYLTPVDM